MLLKLDKGLSESRIPQVLVEKRLIGRCIPICLCYRKLSSGIWGTFCSIVGADRGIFKPRLEHQVDNTN